MSKVIKIKRAYEKPDEKDGERILVDRIWPRGISKENIKINYWLRDIAPSNELRVWFSHDVLKWNEFKRKYFIELDEKKSLCKELLESSNIITLIYGSKNEKYNQASALREYLIKNFL
jgi:uncharacterized protein YeaO (DUF488 family)